MWLHESGKRINLARAEQLLETPADLVSSACPYCVTMLEDGLNQISARPVKVLDLLEIVDKVTR
jgi:Fe-S oxidoreductase